MPRNGSKVIPAEATGSSPAVRRCLPNSSGRRNWCQSGVPAGMPDVVIACKSLTMSGILYIVCIPEKRSGRTFKEKLVFNRQLKGDWNHD